MLVSLEAIGRCFPPKKTPYELPIGFPGPKTNATVLFGESQGLPKVNYVGDFFSLNHEIYKDPGMKNNQYVMESIQVVLFFMAQIAQLYVSNHFMDLKLHMFS